MEVLAVPKILQKPNKHEYKSETQALTVIFFLVRRCQHEMVNAVPHLMQYAPVILTHFLRGNILGRCRKPF